MRRGRSRLCGRRRRTMGSMIVRNCGVGARLALGWRMRRTRDVAHKPRQRRQSHRHSKCEKQTAEEHANRIIQDAGGGCGRRARRAARDSRAHHVARTCLSAAIVAFAFVVDTGGASREQDLIERSCAATDRLFAAAWHRSGTFAEPILPQAGYGRNKPTRLRGQFVATIEVLTGSDSTGVRRR